MAEISEYIYIYICIYIYIHMDTYIYIYIFKVDKGIEFTVLQKTKKKYFVNVIKLLFIRN